VRVVDINAAKEVLDRLHGRPTQPVEQRGNEEELLEYMTREELQAIVDIHDRAQARAAAGERPAEWCEGLDLESPRSDSSSKKPPQVR
jgi:hypothetical protein